MDLVTHKRAISHISNDGKTKAEFLVIGGDKFNKDVEDGVVELFKKQMEAAKGINKFGKPEDNPFKYLK